MTTTLPSSRKPSHSPSPSLSRSSSHGFPPFSPDLSLPHSPTWSSPSSPPSTAPSSVSDLSHCVDASSFGTLQDAMAGIFDKVLADKERNERENRAWEARCTALEGEVRRLVEKVAELEAERVKSCDGCEHAHSRPLDAPPSPPPAWAPWPQPWASLSASPASTPPTSTMALPTIPANAPLPQIDPSKPMSKQNPPPCNSFYLIGHCEVPACKWAHSYALSPSQVDEIRRGARFHICNALKNGVECEDSACPYGHFCPRGSACGRSNCVFNDEQHKHQPMVAGRSAGRRR